MPKNIRQIFYQGQNVLAENLNQVQDYFDEKCADLVSGVLGYGIIQGFTVAKTGPLSISVSKGLAYTKDGKRLELGEAISQLIDSSLLPPSGEVTVQLALAFVFKKTQPVLDVLGETVFTEWIPDVEIKMGNKIAENDLVIANIRLSTTEIVEIEHAVCRFTLENKIRDLIYPVGCTCVQYPNPSTGQFESENSPNALFGGIWELRFNDRGMFFRTEGGNAAEARNESNGVQDTAIQHHKHKVEIGGHNHTAVTGHNSWGLRHDGGSKHKDGQVGRWNEHTSWVDYGTKEATEIMGGNSTSTETRPINMLMRIWQRIA